MEFTFLHNQEAQAVHFSPKEASQSVGKQSNSYTYSNLTVRKGKNKVALGKGGGGGGGGESSSLFPVRSLSVRVNHG